MHKVGVLIWNEAPVSLQDRTEPDARSPLRNDRINWTLTIGYLLIVAIAAFQLTGLSLNHDVGDFLLEVKSLSEGRPYRDANMPANLWLPSASILISEKLPYYLADIHQSVLFAYSVFCTALFFALMKHVGDPLIRTAAILGATAILLILPGYHFGQREHLFALSCAPLLALLYNRYVGVAVPVTLAIAVCAVAAFGASQKPYFILFLMTLGAIDMATKKLRSVSWEFLLIGFFLAIYFLWIQLTYPTYFFGALGDALKTLGVMRLPLDLTIILAFLVPLASIKLFFCNIAMLGFGAHLDRKATPLLPRLFFDFIAIGFLAWLFALMQRFDFDYHFLPFKLFVACASLIIVAWLIGKATAYLKSRGVAVPEKVTAASGYALVALYLLFLLNALDEKSRLQLSRDEVLADPFTKYLQALPPRTPILMLSTRVTPITPNFAYSDIRWTGGFMSLLGILPLANALTGAEGADPALTKAALDFGRDVSGSFVNPSPQVVFVDVSKVFGVFVGFQHPDIVQLLSRTPEFRQVWSGYEKVGHIKTIYDQELDIYEKK